MPRYLAGADAAADRGGDAATDPQGHVADDQTRALLNLDTAREVISLSNDNIVAAEESLRLAEERYRVGSGTLLDVFTAQEALARAKSDLAGAQYDYLIAQATLDGALGKRMQSEG